MAVDPTRPSLGLLNYIPAIRLSAHPEERVVGSLYSSDRGLSFEGLYDQKSNKALTLKMIDRLISRVGKTTILDPETIHKTPIGLFSCRGKAENLEKYVGMAVSTVKQVPPNLIMEANDKDRTIIIEETGKNKFTDLRKRYPELAFLRAIEQVDDTKKRFTLNEGTWKLLFLTHLLAGQLHTSAAINALTKVGRQEYVENIDEFLVAVSSLFYRQELERAYGATLEGSSISDMVQTVPLPKSLVRDVEGEIIFNDALEFEVEVADTRDVYRDFKSILSFIKVNHLQSILPTWVGEAVEFMELFITGFDLQNLSEHPIPLRTAISRLKTGQNRYTYNQFLDLFGITQVVSQLFNITNLDSSGFDNSTGGMNKFVAAMALEKYLESKK